MKRILFIFLIGLSVQAQDFFINSSEELQSFFKSSIDSAIVILAPGIYDLQPIQIIDSTCGNCQNPDTLINATAGLILRGKSIKLIGDENYKTIIKTNSGYGIYVLNSGSVELKNLVITGGERDTSGMATDAAIVIKNSRAVIENNLIKDNIGDSSQVVRNVVGIMGICGRENSLLVIRNNKIIRNSWDGITLYRDSEAIIEDNIVDGVDKATSKIAGGGRGVAIGITWNAKATVKSNLLKRYWKGLGIFVDAEVEAELNIIEDMLTWGIAYWDAGIGNPIGFINNNIIYNTGACGTSISRETGGEITGHYKNNILALTGQNPKYDSPDYYCYQSALAIHSQPESFHISDNIFYNNRTATDDLPNYDLSKDEFVNEFSIWESNFTNKFFKISDFYNYLTTLK